MEMARVLISESNIFDLSSLPPVSSPFIIFMAKVLFSQEAKAIFQGREVAELFKPIKKGDNSAAVDKIKRRQFPIACPRSSRRADTLKLKAKAANRGEMVVRRANAEPVSRDNRRKGGVGKPGIFKPKDRTMGGFGGGSKVERGVVRGRAAGGSKGGVGEGQAPFRINKDTVKTGEDRGS
jgi:hypothetical protein